MFKQHEKDYELHRETTHANVLAARNGGVVAAATVDTDGARILVRERHRQEPKPANCQLHYNDIQH